MFEILHKQKLKCKKSIYPTWVFTSELPILHSNTFIYILHNFIGLKIMSQFHVLFYMSEPKKVDHTEVENRVTDITDWEECGWEVWIKRDWLMGTNIQLD